MVRDSIINNDVLKIKLQNISIPDNYNKFFSYTEKIEPLNMLKIISNQSFKNRHQFFFQNNKTNSSLIALGASDIIELETYNPGKITNQIIEKLDAIINISDNDHITPKFLGGYKFDFQRHDSKDWSTFPKGYFFLPEYSVSYNNKETWLTIIKPINANFNIQSTIDDINSICNDLNSFSNSKNIIMNHNEDSKTQYLKNIENLMIEMNQKSIEKVVYSRSKTIKLKNNLNLSLAMEKLCTKYPDCINFFINIPNRGIFLGSTPEQLIHSNRGQISTEAIAGTISRGNNKINDLELEHELKTNLKYINEHEIVVEEIKNILAPKLINIEISREPAIFKMYNLQHLITCLKGTLKNNTHILDLVEALHPTPAVAGTPRYEAMQLITKYESHDRGWYAAPLGWVDQNGNGDFCVALRSAYVMNNEMKIFAGGGIVNKSIPEDEWEETEIKFKTILSIFKDSNNE